MSASAPVAVARGVAPEAVEPAAKAVARAPVARHALQAVAAMEAVKGAVVVAAGFGLLSLLHQDVRQIAVALVTRLQIDPELHYVGIFLDAAARVTDAKLWGFAALAVAYTLLRWVEAYGLWTNRRWAAWLGAASGAIYVPIEVWELLRHPTWVKGGALIFNVGLVAYLLWTLRQTAESTTGRPTPTLAETKTPT